MEPIVTQKIAEKLILCGACKIPTVGKSASLYSQGDLIWAGRFVEEKMPLPLWTYSRHGQGDGGGDGNAYGNVYGYGGGGGYGDSYGNGGGGGYGYGDGGYGDGYGGCGNGDGNSGDGNGNGYGNGYGKQGRDLCEMIMEVRGGE